MTHKYTVIGGVFTDTTFKTCIKGQEEAYGPFDTYAEAYKAWWEATCRQVDICEHRLFIRKMVLTQDKATNNTFFVLDSGGNVL